MKPNPIITILIVNYNTADFIIHAIWCLRQLTDNPYKVVVADNNSAPEDYAKLEKYCRNKDEVTCYRKENLALTGSMAHGTTLNELVEKVDTPYFSVLDADATWLMKDWDTKMISLIDGQIKMVGTQASGDKPRDFPLMYTILIETETFLKLKGDFRPTEDVAVTDTGMKLRQLYQQAGYTGRVLPGRNTRTYHDGPFHELLGVIEYYLGDDVGQIVASHFGRGSSLGAAKLKGSTLLYHVPILGKALLTRRGRREKERWIQIGREIVRSQLSV